MRSKTTLATLALLLGAALPALAATPFGQFGGKVGGGNVGSGTLSLHGGALDDDGVEAVDLLVDGVVPARANYGRSRPGVTKQFPGFPDSAAPGFAFQLDTSRYPNGRHVVTPRVRSESGEERLLNSRAFQFQNSSYQLKPTGEIEFPLPGTFGRATASGVLRGGADAGRARIDFDAWLRSPDHTPPGGRADGATSARPNQTAPPR